MWPFATRIVDDDTVRWQLDAFEWFIRHLSGDVLLADVPSLVPGKGHFVADRERGHALGLRIFEQVRQYVRLGDDVTVALVVQPPRRGSIVNERVALHHEKPEPLGTCRALGPGQYEVSYDPELLKDHENLISTFAHELAHVLVPPGSELPVAEDEYEFLIDLCVAFLGFGVFLSNTCAQRQTDGAWSWWRGGGYLPINDRIMATALFVALKESEADRALVLEFLRSELRGTFKKALRQLRRFETELSRLRALAQEVAEAPRASSNPVPILPWSMSATIVLQPPVIQPLTSAVALGAAIGSESSDGTRAGAMIAPRKSGVGLLGRQPAPHSRRSRRGVGGFTGRTPRRCRRAGPGGSSGPDSHSHRPARPI